MNRNIIIKYITANNIDCKLYYFDKYKIPYSILRNITMHKSEKLNIRVEIFNIKRQKSYGLLYGLCNEIGQIMENKNEYDYIFCAPTICAILILLFRYKNKTVIIFPYLCNTIIKFSCLQLISIVNDLKRIFNTSIEFDFSYMEDYNSGIDKFYTYLHNIIKYKYAKILCIAQEHYNNINNTIYISEQIRDYKMRLTNIVNKEDYINCKNIYNLPIIYQIINRS